MAPPSGSPPPHSRCQKFSRTAWVLLAGTAALAYGVYGLYTGRLAVADRFNPWAQLDVMATPDFLTGYKLFRARASPQACLIALAQTGMAYDLLPDRVTGPGCGFESAVRLRNAGVRIGPALSLSCPMALGFFMWERHALQPAAQRHFGQRVAAIDHLGSYACRNVNRGEGSASSAADSPNASRSRHATANALDIAGFTLHGGQRISVPKDWGSGELAVPQESPARASGKLLAEARQGACRFFDGVLGPDYNAVHRDHFHFESGGYRMCR